MQDSTWYFIAKGYKMKITLPLSNNIGLYHENIPIPLDALGLNEENLEQLTKTLNLLKNAEFDQIAFLYYREGTITFFKYLATWDVPVYLRILPTGLLEHLRTLEAAILQNIDRKTW